MPSGRSGMSHDMNRTDHTLALVLSGGNALGAYQAGAYDALHAHGLAPDLVAGASIGAVNGAVICGNTPENRRAQLERLWMPGPEREASAPHEPNKGDEARRTAAASWTMATGRTDLFAPRNLLGPWWNPSGDASPASLYDAMPMLRTLERLADFDLLNRGSPRYLATAVDIETGEDIVFDTRTHRVTPDHVRASTALLPAFAPVDIGGRLLGDGGLSANLPLDSVLCDPGERPLLCIALDLLPLHAPRPETLGETVIRMQDLMFATQSRRSIAAWQAIHNERARHGATASITLVHIAYANHAREVSGKAFDFSPQSVAERWASGREDLTRALAAIDAGAIGLGDPGLSVYSRDRSGSLEKVRWPLGPDAG